MDYKIIYEDDSELSDFEALNKSFRRDAEARHSNHSMAYSDPAFY